jgi:hypothetical protein
MMRLNWYEHAFALLLAVIAHTIDVYIYAITGDS